MKEKYYTPEIEEFHVGFEFERPNTINRVSWVKTVFENGECAEQYCKYDESRVKHLDREDIESMGFQTYKDEQGNPNVVYERELDKSNIRGNDLVHILHNHVSKWVGVFIGDSETPYSDWETRFTGTIKNKSELKRLLKQLGIC